MTRDEIIQAQTEIRDRLTALTIEQTQLSFYPNWTHIQVQRVQEIQDEKNALNAEFRKLANQRVAH